MVNAIVPAAREKCIERASRLDRMVRKIPMNAGESTRLLRRPRDGRQAGRACDSAGPRSG